MMRVCTYQNISMGILAYVNDKITGFLGEGIQYSARLCKILPINTTISVRTQLILSL